MRQTVSQDGTRIAYDRLGSGPAVVVVGGGAVTRAEQAPLAEELAAGFTVFNYDRRGRGDSGDTQPYALEREFEDIAALLAEAGGSAHLYGISSGGALAMEAAASGLPVSKIAVYEVPYIMAENGIQLHREYVQTLHALLTENRRGDAFALFMRLAGASEEMIEEARNSPVWAGCEAIAPTLAYDAAALGNSRPPAERLAKISQPVLVATGGASADSFVAGGGSFFDDAAEAIMACLPNGIRTRVPGQTHMVDPKSLAPVLAGFFSDS